MSNNKTTNNTQSQPQNVFVSDQLKQWFQQQLTKHHKESARVLEANTSRYIQSLINGTEKKLTFQLYENIISIFGCRPDGSESMFRDIPAELKHVGSYLY